ncbi:hypothetical protein Y032_0468g2019 [Ancylostoma ceylanicum]|uniref:Uncharacterized protein n=1 Tax=Ancylostoma ceylanicum TaxID=53326 RepID=A0A016VJE9_9BILA|nr:hypothetical protein Y032_0008g155 [Ancylostoma ceylanicum]EYC44232.1 hypothetical protein Y032_0468g2019 [Ancylostoma ceylanicum]
MGANSLRLPEEPDSSTSRHIGGIPCCRWCSPGLSSLSPPLHFRHGCCYSRSAGSHYVEASVRKRPHDYVLKCDKCELERLTQVWSDLLAQFGLCLYVTKTKYLTNLST